MARPSLSDLTELAQGRAGGKSQTGDEPAPARPGDRPAALAPESCGEIDIRIARDGTWFYHGSPIGRKPLVKLFSAALRRESDGSYWLVTPAERVRIRVDDAPFVAVAVALTGAGRDAVLTFRTNVDDEVRAGSEHGIRVAYNPETGEPAPYIVVREGLEALIARPVYYDLVALGREEMVNGRTMFGVWSGGEFFALGSLDSEPAGGAAWRR